MNFICTLSPNRYFKAALSDGVMVAQGSLEAFVMVRIHVGQPLFPLAAINNHLLPISVRQLLLQLSLN